MLRSLVLNRTRSYINLWYWETRLGSYGFFLTAIVIVLEEFFGGFGLWNDGEIRNESHCRVVVRRFWGCYGFRMKCRMSDQIGATVRALMGALGDLCVLWGLGECGCVSTGLCGALMLQGRDWICSATFE